MEINAVKIGDTASTNPSPTPMPMPTVRRTENVQPQPVIPDDDQSRNQTVNRYDKRKELSKEELSSINSELNKFMSFIDPDIKFMIHEKSKQLMVQFVDTKNQRVIKEFPSHEMLDMMANIREYVGALLDKRA